MASSGKSKHQKKIEKLEREKLELEVAQLKNGVHKKNRLPFVAQAIIPILALLVAFFSTYLSVYKDSSENKLEGISARNEAILQENQTILELIDLERRKDTLGRQVKGFESERNRLIAQSDSAQIMIVNQKREKAVLAGTILSLGKTKVSLESELAFSELNLHIQAFKQDFMPNSQAFEAILNETIKNQSLITRTLDSLDFFFENSYLFQEYNLESSCEFLSYLISGNKKFDWS